jgi:predicted acylesterase/phospholipase RssA
MKSTFACIAAVFAVALASGGCSLKRGPAVPRELTTAAVVPGIPNSRIWANDNDLEPIKHLMLDSIDRERAHLEKSGPLVNLPPAYFLAISGGGEDGAYGAGLICAWTETGHRPEFRVVTGISTGALIAPFAFLGPEYDKVLREMYTTIKTDRIMKMRFFTAALTDDALADTAPLGKLLASYIDEKFLKAVAAEYAKGRLLLIGTTNLDARRAVIWNIGAIASSGDPGAVVLVRKILIASAAIPAAFPPVLIDVEADGKKYQEMHVDGGALRQVFLYPIRLHFGAESLAMHMQRPRTAYVIRNARLDPDWAATQRQTLKIAARAISALIASQGVGDLYRLYLTTRRDGIDFNLAFIPPEFDLVPKESFDPEYMKPLFELGRRDMLEGKAWHKSPPGFDESDLAPALTAK